MIKFNSVEPTIFFTEKDGKLHQMINVRLESKIELSSVMIEIDLGQPISCIIQEVKRGEHLYQIYIPDIRERTCISFSINIDGKIIDRLTAEWRPSKHWEIYMVPIAHHDLGYTDTIEGVLKKYHRIFHDVLRFCEETDDFPEEAKFRYMVEESWSIQHFVENSSEGVLEKLGRYIREGRIEIPALFGNEISVICSHEELVRLMYPSFQIAKRFGASIRSASITDVPGLSWGIPTVLAGAGIRYFFAGLPTYFEWGRNDIHTFWDESAVLRPHGRPDAFYWKGPDGNSVLVFYQGGYGCWSPQSYDEIMEGLSNILTDLERRGYPFSVMRFGGYGCGDNTETNVIVSYLVRDWNGRWAYPKLIVATNSMFFERLEKESNELRTFTGELPDTDYTVGTLSSALETTLNRNTHDKLVSAEKLSAIASLTTGTSYPTDDIRDAYNNMMLYDEHTWGKSYQVGYVQDWAWSEKSRFAYKAAGLAESIMSDAMDAISSSIRLSENRNIIVFNSLSFERTDIVTVPGLFLEGPFEIIDTEAGESVPYQVVEIDSPQSPTPYSAGRYARGLFSKRELFDLTFVAYNVPPMGYKTYRIIPKDKAPVFNSDLSITDELIENKFFRISLNPETGMIESIYDKELCIELIDTSAPHKMNQVVVRYVETGSLETYSHSLTRIGKKGPILGSIIMSTRLPGCPQITQEVVLYNDIKRIDFNSRILKDSTPAMEVYIAFPFLISNPNFAFEGTNSIIRPLIDQFPGSNSNYYSVQHWAHVFNEQFGIIFTPIDAHLTEFGGLWPCYVSQAHHGVTPPDFGSPFVTKMDRGYIYSFVIDSNFRTNFKATQQGDVLFRYSMTTHPSNIEGLPRDFGWTVCNPLIANVVNGTGHGNLKERFCFCQLDKRNVMVTAFKKAEDGNGYILRLTEMEGLDTRVSIRFQDIKFEKAFLTDLVENNTGQIAVRDGKINVEVKSFGIVTLRLCGGST